MNFDAATHAIVRIDYRAKGRRCRDLIVPCTEALDRALEAYKKGSKTIMEITILAGPSDHDAVWAVRVRGYDYSQAIGLSGKRDLVDLV